MSHQPATTAGAHLADWVRDARQRTLDLVADLSDEQLLVPRLRIINPPLWELGHVAWFQEKWLLRRHGEPSLRDDADALYDSAAVAHRTRWDLHNPGRRGTLDYLAAVQERVLRRLDQPREDTDAYFAYLTVFHEDMHGEAFAYTRQTLAYPPPVGIVNGMAVPSAGGPLPGDVTVPGGSFRLGACDEEPFVFDNEQDAHVVEVKPFAIARAPVTQAEFAVFVEAGGYEQAQWWHPDGWHWRQTAEAAHPVYWRRGGASGWQRRHFDRWVELEPHRPVLHVNWYEADAYCRWLGRRLPTEAEWEMAAAGVTDARREHSTLANRRFPWGDSPPTPQQANLDGAALGCIDVGSLAAGDSACGCRQLLGNVWEWTADRFGPYPQFRPGPYREYSEPWFGTHNVLRGGCWVTRARLLRNSWRNFYTPDRRDVWSGFRTCAL